MSLRSPTEDENANFVMPAWMAGIQVRKDASGDIHVNLGSSSPCWNDEIERSRSLQRRIFEGAVGVSPCAYPVFGRPQGVAPTRTKKVAGKVAVVTGPAAFKMNQKGCEVADL